MQDNSLNLPTKKDVRYVTKHASNLLLERNVESETV